MLDRDRSSLQSAATATPMFRLIPGPAAGRNAAAAAPYYLSATTTTLPDAAAARNNTRSATSAASDGGQQADRGAENDGSKDESFFEAKPWLDSDSEDDFYSVRGDFTPRGSISTPDHLRRTQFSGRIKVEIPKPPPVAKKQRLIDFLQEKQHYDDDDDEESATDISGDMENCTVHAQKHLKPARKGERAKKPSKSGCFPDLIWKHGFKMCRSSTKTEQRPK